MNVQIDPVLLMRPTDRGISDVRIDLPAQRVFVTSTLSCETILEAIQKTGKATKHISSQ